MLKQSLKFIASFICYAICTPIFLVLTFALAWYVLPAIQTTFVGEWLLSLVSAQEIFIISLCLIGGAILFYILGNIFNTVKNSKVKNFYTHMLTWCLAILLIAESLFIFFVSDSLQTVAIELTLFRKIAIGAGVFSLLLYQILSKKVGELVDRRIQAYDTAKELNANGRSSVIGMQILKTLDFIFPEAIILLVLCFAFNFEISLYFIFILASFALPVIGNIICDKRARKEAIQKSEEEKFTVVNETAEAVVELLKEQQSSSQQ